jgi:hypothetical protein
MAFLVDVAEATVVKQADRQQGIFGNRGTISFYKNQTGPNILTEKFKEQAEMKPRF